MPPNAGLKTEQYPSSTQYGALGNQALGNPNPPSNYGGMGILNYNAFSQRQYDELKQQFFRPPNIARPSEQYNRMGEGNYDLKLDTAHNFGQMNLASGINSSS